MQDYFFSNAFTKHRKKIIKTITDLPFQDPPAGWAKQKVFVIGGLQYIGFSDDSNYLLVVSTSGRGVIDLSNFEMIARDREEYGDWLDDTNLICTGIGPLGGKQIRIAGSGGGLPLHTKYNDSLYVAAPLFPCYDVVYQPAFQHCLNEKHSKDCVTFYRGFAGYCGFSWSGDFMAVIDEDLHLWKRI